MKELREKIAAVLYYFGASVSYLETVDQDDLPQDAKDAIKHYYEVKDKILDKITEDKNAK